MGVEGAESVLACCLVSRRSYAKPQLHAQEIQVAGPSSRVCVEELMAISLCKSTYRPLTVIMQPPPVSVTSCGPIDSSGPAWLSHRAEGCPVTKHLAKQDHNWPGHVAPNDCKGFGGRELKISMETNAGSNRRRYQPYDGPFMGVNTYTQGLRD